jgi:hypothetical protein
MHFQDCNYAVVHPLRPSEQVSPLPRKFQLPHCTENRANPVGARMAYRGQERASKDQGLTLGAESKLQGRSDLIQAALGLRKPDLQSPA